jgi:anti-sigma factor RsiW
MTECWSEGELRAWLDRELDAAEMERGERHLGACPECAGRLAAIEARARRVSGWMAALDEAPAPAKPLRARRRWVPAVLAIAASVMLAVAIQSRKPAQPAMAASQAPFVALDDEPIGEGIVVRMAWGPNQIPADVIFSADGRARAFRLVSATE